MKSDIKNKAKVTGKRTKTEYNIITLENLKDTKLSDLIESVIYDIQQLRRNQVKIDMGLYFTTNYGYCSVCLGGAAVCGFVGYECDDVAKAKEIVYDYNSLEGNELSQEETVELFNNIRYLFDSLRMCYFSMVLSYYKDITGIKVPTDTRSLLISDLVDISKGYFGELNDYTIKTDLIPKLKEYVKIFRKYEL